MRIALYKGTSFVSRAIRLITRSPYSHAAFLLDDDSVIEAWEGGVKYSPSISTLHKDRTQVDVFGFYPPLSPEENRALHLAAISYVGRPYDYKSVLRFVTKIRGKTDKRVFCSEMLCECCELIQRPLFLRTPAWKIPPDWLQMTLGLRFEKSVHTTQ